MSGEKGDERNGRREDVEEEEERKRNIYSLPVLISSVRGFCRKADVEKLSGKWRVGLDASTVKVKCESTGKRDGELRKGGDRERLIYSV